MTPSATSVSDGSPSLHLHDLLCLPKVVEEQSGQPDQSGTMGAEDAAKLGIDHGGSLVLPHPDGPPQLGDHSPSRRLGPSPR